jgi:hypothetical protein
VGYEDAFEFGFHCMTSTIIYPLLNRLPNLHFCSQGCK